MSKWEITIDIMMIIGKYFRSNCDYINLVKTCKKYSQILLMYRYNPIGDDRLFKNIETQHFYEYADIFYRKRDMFRYVYWIEPFLIRPYLFKIDSSRCIVKDIKINKILMYATGMNFFSEKTTVYTYPSDLISLMKTLEKYYLIFCYGKDFFGIKVETSINMYPKNYKTKLFVNNLFTDVVCDVFMSARLPNSRLYVRDNELNDVLCMEYFNSGIRLELNNKTIQNYLPAILDAHGWALLKI